MMWLWIWGARGVSEKRILRESEDRRAALHRAAVTRRKKAKRGGRR